MANWNSNNRACTTTWTSLMVLNQNKRNFANSGNVKMSQLTFWNSSSSSEIRKTQASSLAIQMNNIFIKIRGAKLENGVTVKKAIEDMINVLTDSSKTIANLANTNDDNYYFWNEKNPI